eukprot:gene2661-1934_t
MQQQKNIFPGEFKPEDTFKIRDYLLDFDDDGDDSALTTSFDSKPSYDKRTFEEIDDHQNKLKLSLVYMFMDLEDICAEVRRSWEQLRSREIHVLEPIVISIAAMHLVRKLQAEFKLMFPEIECFLKDIFGDVIPGGDIFSPREAKAFMNIQIVREFASICAAIEQFRKVFTLDKKPTRHKPFYEDSGDPLTFEPARLVKFYETDLCLLLDRVEDSMGDSIPQDALKQSALCTSMLLYPINDAFLYDWYYLQAVFFIWVWVTSVQVMSDPVYLLKSKLVYVYRRWRRKINQNYYQSRLAGVMPAIDAVYTTPMSHFVFHELYQTEDNHFFCGWNDVLYNNPLIAGSLLLDTVLLQRDTIQQGGDCFFSLFRAVSFLYVALRQEGYLHVPIPLVELIISAYKEHGLFHPMQHPSSSEVPGPNGADTTSHRENTYNIPSIEEYFGRYLSAERVSLSTISAIQTALRSATHKDQIETAKKKLKIALEVSRRKFQASIQQQNKQMIATYFASASTLEVQYSRVYGDYDSGAHYYSTERKECISLPHSPYRSRTLEVVYERCLPMEKPVRTSVEEELGLPVAGAGPVGEQFIDEATGIHSFPTVTAGGPLPAHHRQDCSRILESTARMFQREMSVTKHLSLDVNLVLSKLIVFFSVLMQRMPIVAEGMAGVPMPTTPCTVPSSSGAVPSAAGSGGDASATNGGIGGASDLKGRYLYALGDAVVTWALPLLDVSPSERTSYQDELLRTLATYFVDILGRGELADVDYVDNKFCLFPDVRGATKNIFAEEFGFPLPAACPAAYQQPPPSASASATGEDTVPPTAEAGTAVPPDALATTPTAAPTTLPPGVQQTYHDVLALLARMKHSATPTAVMSAFHTASNNIGLYAMLSFSAHRDVDVPTGPQGNTLLHEAFATGCDAVIDALYFYDFAKTLLLTPNDHDATPRDCYPANRFAMWKSLMETPEMKRQVLTATANAASMPTSTSVTTSHALRVPRWILEHEDFITLDMFHQAIAKSTAAHGAPHTASGSGGGGALSHHATSSSSSAAAGAASSLLPSITAAGALNGQSATSAATAAASAFNGMFAGGLIDAAALGLGGLPGGTTASAAMFGGGGGGGGSSTAAATAAAAAINLQDANYMASLWQQLLTMKEDPHFAEKVSYHFQQVMTQISRDHRQAPGSTISLNEYCSNMVQWIYDHPEAWQTMKTGGSGGETPLPTPATSTAAVSGGGGGGVTAATSVGASKTTNKTASKATASK